MVSKSTKAESEVSRLFEHRAGVTLNMCSLCPTGSECNEEGQSWRTHGIRQTSDNVMLVVERILGLVRMSSNRLGEWSDKEFEYLDFITRDPRTARSRYSIGRLWRPNSNEGVKTCPEATGWRTAAGTTTRMQLD